MATMEMEFNLKKMANFFQVPSEYFGKIAKTDYSLFLLGNHFIFLSRCCIPALCQTFEQF